MTVTDADRRFLRALTRAGSAGLMVDELAEGLGVSQPRVRSRASRLVETGLVNAERSLGFAFYKLTKDGVKENRRGRPR